MNLRAYQSDAVDWIGSRRMSCVVAPAGAGKTIIAAAIVARYGLTFSRCAWLANTRDQCDQARVALDRVTLPAGLEVEVGCYGSFSTLEGFDLVILDEAHHLPSRTVYLLIQTMRQDARLVGFTATPKHSNPERNEVMRQVFSDGFFVIQKSEVMDAGGLVPGRVEILRTSQPGAFDSLIEIELQEKMRGRFFGLMRDERESQLRNQITHDLLRADPQRNALIAATACAHLASGAKVLVLVGTVEHADLLAATIPGAAACFSRMGIKRRRETIGAFKDPESAVRCLVATSLADEGLDCPVAEVVIMACGGREFGRVIQRVGRVMRPHIGKSSGLIIELEDAGARTANSQHRARLRVYRSEGYV
jgi:superfamily II DNA or RNA helicase